MCCSCPTHAVESRVLRRLAKDGFGRLFYWPLSVNESATCMRHNAPMSIERSVLLTSVLLLAGNAALAQAAVYRCPGPPVLYTDTISAQEAKERNCRSIEGAPITVMSGPPRKPAPVAASGPRASDSKVDPGEQRSRDSEARRILQEELKREEERLAGLQAEYKGGEPDRLGGEKNYAKYQERVASLKASITRTEADIAALKRELAKLPPASQ